MELKIEYKTDGYFTMGELRAIVAQMPEKNIPDEAQVHLLGQERIPSEHGEKDFISIVWDEA
jgi:hypothetical protein